MSLERQYKKMVIARDLTGSMEACNEVERATVCTMECTMDRK